MDAAKIRGLKSKLRKYLQQYGDCFGRCDTRGHLNTYVTGQLSKLDRKSVEPIALAAGVAPRTLQQFLNSLEWDQEQLIDILQWLVAGKHTSEHSIGLIDETSCPKKGDKTPGVQRQWCGATGKQDNCVTRYIWAMRSTTFIACWTASCFCRRVGRKIARVAARRTFPDEMVYRPKWRDRLGVVRSCAGQRGLVSLSDVRRRIRRKTRVSAGIGGPRASVCGRGAAHFHGLVAGALCDRSPYRRQGRGRGRPCRGWRRQRAAQSVEQH